MIESGSPAMISCRLCLRRMNGLQFITIQSNDSISVTATTVPQDGQCAWPRCDKDALCRSGNFGDQLVCAEHFRITNGSGEFTSADTIGVEAVDATHDCRICGRTAVDCQTASTSYCCGACRLERAATHLPRPTDGSERYPIYTAIDDPPADSEPSHPIPNVTLGAHGDENGELLGIVSRVGLCEILKMLADEFPEYAKDLLTVADDVTGEAARLVGRQSDYELSNGKTLTVADTITDAAFLDECAIRAFAELLRANPPAEFIVNDGSRKRNVWHFERLAAVSRDAAEAQLAERNRRRSTPADAPAAPLGMLIDVPLDLLASDVGYPFADLTEDIHTDDSLPAVTAAIKERLYQFFYRTVTAKMFWDLVTEALRGAGYRITFGGRRG